MRNIYYSYKITRKALKNSAIHNCHVGGCQAMGRYVTKTGNSVRKFKVEDKNKMSKLRSKLYESKAKRAYKRLNNTFQLEDFAINKGYIERLECEKSGDTFHSVTEKGMVLTDNLFFPFTPVGLWKEIWKEHKIIFTFLYSLVALITGGALVKIIRFIAVEQ